MCQGNELELVETYMYLGAVVVEDSDRTGNSKGSWEALTHSGKIEPDRSRWNK